VVAGRVIWKSFPATLRTATLSFDVRSTSESRLVWLVDGASEDYDALYKATHHHHHHHHHILDCELKPALY